MEILDSATFYFAPLGKTYYTIYPLESGLQNGGRHFGYKTIRHSKCKSDDLPWNSKLVILESMLHPQTAHV